MKKRMITFALTLVMVLSLAIPAGATTPDSTVVSEELYQEYTSSTLKNSSEGSAGVLGYFVDIYGFGETSSAFETFRIIPERTTYK